MKIALDAMGGDNAPEEIVKGALLAAEKLQSEIVLVGDEARIRKIAPHLPNSISIVHTDEYITMDESPSVALRQKRNASVIVAANLLKSKEVDAMISAGNTGALLEAVVLHVGRLKSAKIKRPALSVVLPSYKKPTIFLDAGANPDCKPEYLLQFARMGATYAKYMLDRENPTVGLLNIGVEDKKGNQFTQETFALLSASKSINFVGNVEAGAIMRAQVDVAVADGFSGNILLKTAEGIAEIIYKTAKDIIKSNPLYVVGILLLTGVLKKLKKAMDHSEHGGALLFGIDGICIKAHGRAKKEAVCNALKLAEKMIKMDIITKFTEDMNAASEE